MLENFSFLFQKKQRDSSSTTPFPSPILPEHVQKKEVEKDKEKDEEKDVKEEEEEEEEEEDGEEDGEEDDISGFEQYMDHVEKFQIHECRYFAKVRVKYILYGIHTHAILYNDDNRLINEERLNHFSKFDITQSDPIILGKYYDEESEQYVYDIIDGQHRLEVLKSREDEYCNEEVILDIRIYKSRDDYYHILDIVNNRMNFDHTQLRKFKYLEAKSLLDGYFMRKCKKSIWGQRRPYVMEDRLSQKLFQTKYFNKIEHKGSDIFRKMMSINHFLSKQIVYEEKIKNKESYDKLGFYIGVDKEYIGVEMMDVEEADFETFWKSKKKKYA